MKILLAVVFIYAVFYVRTLCSYRSEDYVKTTTEHTLSYNDTSTQTENMNMMNASSTSETTTIAKDSVIEIGNILTRNQTENATIPNAGNSSRYHNNVLHDDKYYSEFGMLAYQLSYINKKITNYNCTEKNERFSLPETCDEYIECKNGVVTSLQCQNGLYFDPANSKNGMPCQYSNDVPCINRTPPPDYYPRECPYDFGYFKIEDKYNCSSFRICEFGNGYDFHCPNGLAFRSDNLRCDWPHKVPECDAEGYAGIRCPNKEKSFHYFRSPIDCQVYYICIYGVPRRQVCEEYMGFDEQNNVCVPADRVIGCDPQLKLAAKQNRILQNQKKINSYDYDDGDGYLQHRVTSLSFFRRVRKPKIISFPTY